MDTAAQLRKAEVLSFLKSIPRRFLVLASAPPLCPFDPQSVASAIIARMEDQATLGETSEVYAHAMQEISPGDRKSWEAIHDAICSRFGPKGLNHIKRIAANINRQNGNMPCAK